MGVYELPWTQLGHGIAVLFRYLTVLFRRKIRFSIKYRVLTDTSPLVGYMAKTVNWGAVASGGGPVGPGGASSN